MQQTAKEEEEEKMMMKIKKKKETKKEENKKEKKKGVSGNARCAAEHPDTHKQKLGHAAMISEIISGSRSETQRAGTRARGGGGVPCRPSS